MLTTGQVDYLIDRIEEDILKAEHNRDEVWLNWLEDLQQEIVKLEITGK
jgi:hypothetical protein